MCVRIGLAKSADFAIYESIRASLVAIIHTSLSSAARGPVLSSAMLSQKKATEVLKAMDRRLCLGQDCPRTGGLHSYGSYLLRSRVEHVDLAEPGNGTPMADCVGLGGFAFAVVGCAVEFVGRLAAQTVAGVPEIGCARLIGHIAQHPPDLAFPDFPEGLAAELKIVTLLID